MSTIRIELSDDEFLTLLRWAQELVASEATDDAAKILHRVLQEKFDRMVTRSYYGDYRRATDPEKKAAALTRYLEAKDTPHSI